MFRGSTPTHTFQLPMPASSLTKIRITYSQFGRTVLEKREADVSSEENTIKVTLKQEETLKFKWNEDAKIQVKVLTNIGTVLLSRIFTVNVHDVLNTEVL